MYLLVIGELGHANLDSQNRDNSVASELSYSKKLLPLIASFVAKPRSSAK